MEKNRDVTICPSPLGINVQYWSIPESIGSYYLSSVTYLNCYCSDCFLSPSRLCHSQVILYNTGETETSGEPYSNEDISSPNKSMMTVCLHRLEDSPNTMISHQTHDEAKGDWHFSRGLLYGPDWFDCVCISSASIDGNDFDLSVTLSPRQQNPLRWKIHAFYIPVSINLSNCLIKMRWDDIFFVDWTGYWQGLCNENRKWWRK